MAKEKLENRAPAVEEASPVAASPAPPEEKVQAVVKKHLLALLSDPDPEIGVAILKAVERVIVVERQRPEVLVRIVDVRGEALRWPRPG